MFTALTKSTFFSLVLFYLVGQLGGSALGQSQDGTSRSLSNSVPAATAPKAPVRVLDESSLLTLLTDALAGQVGNRGELQLRLTRTWEPVTLPEGAVSLHVVSLPLSGITANCIVRFEVRAGDTLVGTYQTAVHAGIMNDIWVARTALKRGQAFDPAEVVRERRDVIALRDFLTELPEPAVGLELADYVAAKGALTSRSLRARPVLARGDVVEAQANAGALNLRLKVEVLEPGAPGELIRVRNPQTRREFYGKITNDRSIELSL